MFNPCYTQLKLDIQDLTLKDNFGSFLDTIIFIGQEKLEKLIMIDGVGLPFMESSPTYTPGLLKDTNRFSLPADYLQMLYIALTDQLPSPIISLVSTTGTLAAGTYYYRVSAINANGETLGSEEKSITVGATAGVIISWTAITDATGYKIYGRLKDGELYIATTTSATYTDNGSITPSGAMPIFNTSGKDRFDLMDRFGSKKFGDLHGAYIDSLKKVKPFVYEKISNILIFNGYADKNYGIDLRYLKKAKVLSDSITTNEWTDNAYGALLYSCLFETIPYIGDDPRSVTWATKRDEEIGVLKLLNTRERISGKTTNWFNPNMFFSSGK